MLSYVKDFIPLVLYAALLGTSLMAIWKRAQWALYLLVVLVPLPALWYPLHGLPLGKDTMDVLLASAVLGAMVNKSGLQAPRGSGIVWFFILVSFCSLLNALITFGLNLDSGWSFVSNWKNFFEMTLLYFIVYSVIDDERHQKIALTILAVVFLMIAVRAFRNFSAGSAFSYDKRSGGPFDMVGLGPNHFAAFIVHYGALLLGMWLVDTHRWRRWLYLSAVLFGLHPLFFAYSRGAYAALIAVLLVYGLLRNRWLLVALAVFAFTWDTVLPDTVIERITMTSNSDGQLEESAALRVVLWEHAKQVFRDNPAFGIGFFGFEYLMRGNELKNTHNYFMQIAAEQGVIGLTAIALLFLRGYWVAWNLYRRGASTFQQGLGLGFVGCITAVIVTNIFGDRFTQFSLGAYFFIVFGLVERAYAGCRERASSSPNAALPIAEPAATAAAAAPPLQWSGQARGGP
jgi:putative inorganic carbon (hco3(-)) transporter